jgi:hypothetical protein
VFQVIENGEFRGKLDVLRPIPAIPIHISINNTIMEQIKLARPATALLKPIAYWIATGLIVLETAAGAEWDLVRNDLVKQVFAHLGYPLYLLSILGIWKLPAAIVLVIPSFGQAKEWAYAGIVFDLSGAAVSNAINGMPVWHVVAPLVLMALAMVSWKTQDACFSREVYFNFLI